MPETSYHGVHIRSWYGSLSRRLVVQISVPDEVLLEAEYPLLLIDALSEHMKEDGSANT